MIGLARGCWLLACHRITPGGQNDICKRWQPLERHKINYSIRGLDSDAPISAEYYAIIDRLSAGQMP